MVASRSQDLASDAKKGQGTIMTFTGLYSSRVRGTCTTCTTETGIDTARHCADENVQTQTDIDTPSHLLGLAASGGLGWDCCWQGSMGESGEEEATTAPPLPRRPSAHGHRGCAMLLLCRTGH